MTTEAVKNEELTQKSKRKRITCETFLQTWERVRNQGGTINDVSTTLGLGKASVQSRACQLRKMGVPLKTLTRVGGHKAPTLQETLAMLAKVREVSLEEITAESETMLAKSSAE